jgi:hypothetical protein
MKDMNTDFLSTKNDNPYCRVAEVNGSTSWDKWLKTVENALIELGYRRYVQHYKSEDFMYWKTFYDGEDKAYMVGLAFYDFRQYVDSNPHADRISVQFECMLIDIDSRIDLTVSKDISLAEFESMAKSFYEAMSQYCH